MVNYLPSEISCARVTPGGAITMFCGLDPDLHARALGQS